MTEEEYNKRVYESTQRLTELFLSKEMERGKTWVLNPSADYDERRMSVVKAAKKFAIILVNSTNK